MEACLDNRWAGNCPEPEAPEVTCNDEDDDCDGLVDEGLKNPCAECGPVPVEVCDGLDNDCDGDADEDLTNRCGECGALPQEVCDGLDNDCDDVVDNGMNWRCRPGCMPVLNNHTYATVQQAVDAALPGQTVVLTPGECIVAGDGRAGRFDGRVLGVALNPGVHLAGSGADRSFLKVVSLAAVAILDADDAVIRDLDVTNPDPNLRPLVHLDAHRSIVDRCTLHGGQEGVWVGEHAVGARIQRNTLLGNERGVLVNRRALGVEIIANTLVNNTFAGVDTHTDVELRNNLFLGDRFGAILDACPPVAATHNAYWGHERHVTCSDGNDYDPTARDSNVTTDPVLEEVGPRIYRLGDGSSCIEAGVDVDLPSTPDDRPPDIGAHERSALGDLTVETNHDDAWFILDHPGARRFGRGRRVTFEALPVETYLISFQPIDGFHRPPLQSIFVAPGSTAVSAEYKRDEEPPRGRVMLDFGAPSTRRTAVDILIDLDDRTPAASLMRLSADGQTWDEARPFAPITRDWQLNGPGVHQVHAMVADEWGNWGMLEPATIRHLPEQLREVATSEELMAALAEAQEGDTILVAPGDYRVFDRRVAPRVRLLGAGAALTRLTTQQLYLDEGAEVAGFRLDSPSNPLHIAGNGVLVRDNEMVSETIDKAIYLVNGVRGVEVRNNRIDGQGILGEEPRVAVWNRFVDVEGLNEETFAARVVNNTITGLTAAAWCDNGCERVELVNNALSDLTHLVVSEDRYWEGQAQFVLSHNAQWQITAVEGVLGASPLLARILSPRFFAPEPANLVDQGHPDAAYADRDGSQADIGVAGGPATNTPPIVEFSMREDAGRFVVDAGASKDRETPDFIEFRWDDDGDGTWETGFQRSSERTLAVQPQRFVVQARDDRGLISERVGPQ